MPYSVHSFNATKSFVSVGVLITKTSLVVDASFISASAVTAFATTLEINVNLLIKNIISFFF
jgi:hypothetical protein